MTTPAEYREKAARLRVSAAGEAVLMWHAEAEDVAQALREAAERLESDEAEIRRLYAEVQDRAQETLDAQRELQEMRRR